jgi:caffeoyl-CoA O-methyltransferase
LRALPKDGKLFTFEFNPHHANVAKESFKKAGFENQVEIFVGPALDNLAQIEKEGPFDLVFIDADKVSYSHYLEWAADHLRIGGVVLGDNTFAFGMIADADPRDADKRNSVKALQAFNRDIVSSGRFRATILPTGEGLTMGVKLR